MIRYVIVLSSLVLFSEGLLACSCKELTEIEQVDRADFVFLARITSVREAPLRERPKMGMGVEASFELLDMLKGNEAEIPNLLVSGNHNANCGVKLIVGRPFLIHTDETGYVSICNGTRRMMWDMGHDVESVIEKYRNYISDGQPFKIEPTSEWKEDMRRIYCGDGESEDS